MSTNTTTANPARMTTINAERFKQTVFFRMKVRRWGNRAKVKDGSKLTEYLRQKQAEPGTTTAAPTVTGDVSGKVAASKILMTSPALDAINDHLTATKERLVGRFGMAMPSNIQSGLFVARVESVQTFEDIIDEAITKLNLELIPALRADFAPAIERARTLPVRDGGLGPLFDEADYCTVDDACSAFEIEHFWLSLDVPENLGTEELRAAAKERLERQFSEAADEVKLALREGFQQLVAHAAEALKPGADGAKKIFRNSLTDNIQAFIDSFNARNVMGDAELAALVEKARSVLQIETGGKATADVIRKNESLRAGMANKFGEIAATLGAMVETERSRQFSFDE